MAAGGEEKAVFEGLKNDADQYLPQAADKAAQFATETAQGVDRGVASHVEQDAQLGHDFQNMAEHPPEPEPVGTPAGAGGAPEGADPTPKPVSNAPVPKPETQSLAPSGGQDAEASGREQGSGGSSNDPVDLVTGEMYLPQVDLRLEGIVPLVLERRYGSFYRRGQCFGATWASTLDQRVEVDGDGIHYAAPDGRVLHYPVPTVHGQKVMPSHGPRWPLTWNRAEDLIEIEQGELGYTLTFHPGPRPEISRPLSAQVDRGGNRISFIYDVYGIPTDVYHSGGYHVVVESIETRGGVRVSGLKLADPGGGAATPVRSFRYDMAGRLTGVVNASGQELAFEYDLEDRITQWVDRNGFDYRYHYRGDGRVIRGEGTNGFLAVTLDYDLEARVTTMTDALGNSEAYHWNERLQTVKVVDALGGETHMRHTRYGDEVEVTDQLGRTTTIERDGFGDALAVQRPDGTVASTVYDRLRRPVTVTDPDGAVWQYAYDAVCAQLAAVTDPAGAQTTYARDEQGRITAITDPLGRTTRVVCDRAGLPTQITDPDGAAYTYRRDRFGRIIEMSDPAGAVTRIAWDTDGHPLDQTLPDGALEHWRWDAEGNLIEHTDATGAVTTYEYGPFDVVTACTDPHGARRRFDYDLQLRPVAVTAPNGAQWTYLYDAAGRTVRERDFNGTTTTYGFDAAGQLVRRANALGQVLGLDYDAMGRVVGRDIDGELHRYTYDRAGRLTLAEGLGAAVAQSFDACGRVLSESLGEYRVASTYDQAGQRRSRTTSSGIEISWSYDRIGKPSQIRTSHGVIDFERDALGRETTRRLSPSASITTGYDLLGRITGQALWRTEEPGGAWRSASARTYAYRGSTPTAIEDQLRGVLGLELDAAGRVTEVTGTYSESYAYDTLGNISAAQFAVASASEPREVEGTIVRAAGRTGFHFDAAGRLTRRTRRTLSGTLLEWHFTWNADDQLTAVTTPEGHTWRYSYDPLGRRAGKTHTGSDGQILETVAFAWDGPRLVEQITTTPDGTAKALAWDYLPGTFTPLAQTRRTWATSAPQPEIDAAFHAIISDLVGTPMELVDPGGAITWQASTTLWGVALAGPPACPLAFPGQYRDEETGLCYNLNRYYDPETAAYITPDPLGLAPAPNPHRYVENPLVWIDPLGLAAYKTVYVNDAGRFGDFNPGTPGDGLEAHHMPQDGLGFLKTNEGGAIVIKHEDHRLTRTYKSRGRATKAAETGLPFRTVLARDIADLRSIGQTQYGDPSYFNPGIKKLLAYYRSIGQL